MCTAADAHENNPDFGTKKGLRLERFRVVRRDGGDRALWGWGGWVGGGGRRGRRGLGGQVRQGRAGRVPAFRATGSVPAWMRAISVRIRFLIRFSRVQIRTIIGTGIVLDKRAATQAHRSFMIRAKHWAAERVGV